MRGLVAVAICLAASACAHADHSPAASSGLPAIVKVESAYGFEETVSRLDAALTARGLKSMKIDHTANAAASGLLLRPTTLFIFGNPKAGTPLMNLAPSIGVDLPLRTLVYAEGEKATLVYNDIESLAARHGVAEDAAPLGAMKSLLTSLVSEAAGQ